MKFKRVAIDTSKHVFTLHGVDEQERPVLRRELKRVQVEAFFAKQEATEVVLEACGGSHHWGRLLIRLGHQVRLIPPQYVKLFVKRTKNDRNDAEAISEAASRPTMRSVVVKSVDQQAAGIILKHREMLVGQRTQAINALRTHAMEFGVVAAVDGELAVLHKANPVSRLLAEIPGVGPLGAITMALTVEPGNFASARHFAAWLGLTPKEHSTGGKQRLGKISKAGNERLRQLLFVGAMSVIRFAKPGSKSASAWLLQLLQRKPRKLAAVALANKMARIIWAMMARGEAYRRQPVAA